jgi:hypothetical protein
MLWAGELSTAGGIIATFKAGGVLVRMGEWFNPRPYAQAGTSLRLAPTCTQGTLAKLAYGLTRSACPNEIYGNVKTDREGRMRAVCMAAYKARERRKSRKPLSRRGSKDRIWITKDRIWITTDKKRCFFVFRRAHCVPYWTI